MELQMICDRKYNPENIIKVTYISPFRGSAVCSWVCLLAEHHSTHAVRTCKLAPRSRLLLAASRLGPRPADAPAWGGAVQRVGRSLGRAGGCAGCHRHMHACAHVQPAHLQLDRPAPLANSAVSLRLCGGLGAPASREAAERVSRARIMSGRSAATLSRKVRRWVAGRVRKHLPPGRPSMDFGDEDFLAAVGT